MAKIIKISALGFNLPDADPAAPAQKVIKTVIDYLQNQIKQALPDRPDLIILPEICDSPANYDLASRMQYFEQRGDQVLDALAGIAGESRCYLTYPAIRRLPDGSWRNSVQLIDRHGRVIAVYDKCHPTIQENEAGILSGADAVVADCDFGRVGFTVCFDLNFDELRHKYIKARPDLMIFCSMYHGGLMQSYWAYSGRMHFAAAVSGAGGFILSPLGELLARSTNYFNYVTAAVNLDCIAVHLDYNRERLSALRAKYGPGVRIFDPGYLGSVLVSSEAAGISARDMAREFELELLDDYMERSRAFQEQHRPVSPLIS